MAIVINKEERDMLVEGLEALEKIVVRAMTAERNQAIKELRQEQRERIVNLTRRVQIFEVTK